MRSSQKSDDVSVGLGDNDVPSVTRLSDGATFDLNERLSDGYLYLPVLSLGCFW